MSADLGVCLSVDGHSNIEPTTASKFYFWCVTYTYIYIYILRCLQMSVCVSVC